MTDDTGFFAPAPLRSLPPDPDLDHLRKEAKRRLRLLRATNPEARLAAAQLALARDHGFPSWRRLKAHVDAARGLDELPSPWAGRIGTDLAPAIRRGDVDEMDRMVEALMQDYPGDEELLAYRADLLRDHRGDVEGARAIYDRLLARPTASILTHYAAFLQESGQARPDEVEAIYRRALVHGKDDPPGLGLALNNYACFLMVRRRDLDGAERLLHRAAELECGYARVNATHLGAYAAFLWERRGDASRAEGYFRRSRAFSGKEASVTLAFAAMLTATGRTAEGLALIPEILSSWWLPSLPDPAPVELTCWFLRYAHGPDDQRPDALARLKAHLRPDAGVGQGCLGTLDRNAEAVVAAGHPVPELVRALAVLLSDGGPVPDGAADRLDRHPVWSEAQLPRSRSSRSLAVEPLAAEGARPNSEAT